MSFHDTQRAIEVSLRDRITLKTDDGEWVTGKVIELALLGDDFETVSITIILDNKTVLRLHRVPDAPVLCEFGDTTHPVEEN